MKSCLALLLLAVSADTIIEFKSSQLIDETDLRSNGNGQQFNCPGAGCTLFTTNMTTAEVGIYNDETQVTTLDKIYQEKDAFLVGYKLAPGTHYRLKKTGTGVTNTAVKVYVVYESAGAGDVTDIDDEFDLNTSGKKTVTVLSSSSSGLTFSRYKITTASKIYSAGFDSVGTCIPIYAASAVDNAAYSTIGIVLGIATVDFGSTDASNQIHIEKFVSYTGCANSQPNYNYVPMETYEFNALIENTKVDIKFGEISISQGHELTVKVYGENDLKYETSIR